jgi:SDR family mycofactocin-dependent oxidoreductase
VGKLDGKVVFITGAARGQGRSHAQLLASEGASIIGVDVCKQLDTVSYKMSSAEDLDETVEIVRSSGGKMLGLQADVRDEDSLTAALNTGLEEFGRLDVVLANAGIMAHELPPYPRSRQAWRDSLDVMLTGVWNTIITTVPVLRNQAEGGSIVITSSTAGIRPAGTDMAGGHDGYIAAKFGVVGLMQTYAIELAKYRIRVNTVHPTGVATPMIQNDFFPKYMEAHPTIALASQNKLPVPVVEPIDISRIVLFLASDDSRYVTGSQYRVDAGYCV